MHSEKPLLKELQNLVTPYYAASWRDIGLQLGIPDGTLQLIENDYPSDKKCFTMFSKWLQSDVNASWSKLIKAINSTAIKKITQFEAVEMLETKLKERHIVTRYKSSQDDWFSMPEHFTSVALIHQKNRKTKKEIIEFANMHLKGNFTASGKITTDIADIFKVVEYNSNPYTLLIEGAPGIGKTILSKEIVFQWANGRLLKNETLVCLIYFRDPKVNTIDTFESFINYISYSRVSKFIEQYVCNNSGKGICLIFDGYDEYPEKLRECSFLSDVVNRKVLELQLCNIVVSSRPSASACLHNIVDLRVEILGFTKEHRKSYIMHALKDNPNTIQDLLEYLESSYSVDAYCHIPLSMAILVFLFKESDYDKNQLPTTQTEINYKFICITIRRFIKRSQQRSVSISKFSEVPATHKSILLEISKLAFTALKDDKIVFSASEIGDFCPSLLKDPKDWNGLDLLKAVQYFSLEENTDELSFNFLHFSVQELLAAYHISLMSRTKQIKLLKETFWNIRYFNVWIMYVALTKDQPFAFKHFLSGNRLRILTKFSIWWSGNANISIAKKMKEDKIKCLHLFQCFTEAGNDDMCHYVGNLLQDGTIDLSGQALSAVEMYTLSSFLARCVQRHWSLLDLSNCYLDDENFERFCKSYASLTKSTVYIDTINLSSNVFTQASASQIANLALNFNVKQLIFASNELKDIGLDQATFVALLECPSLVKSRCIKIQDDNQINIVLYKRSSNISELFMMCYCTVETYKDVYLFIENSSSFFEKFINTNSASIFKSMLHSLMSKMASISTNLKLDVKSINITDKEVSNAISSLASNVPLAVRIGKNHLPLLLCNISYINEKVIFSSLGTILFHGEFSIKTIHSAFYFFLDEIDFLNRIYINGITLYDSLMDVASPKCMLLNSVQLLNCCVHDVTTPNAVANMLSQVLSNTTLLEHLNLSGCRLKTEHMKIILEALTQVVSIVTISLSDNNLAYRVFDLLASVITCNRGLQCIELSNCNLQEAGILSMVKALQNCEELRSLDFSNNVITDDVAVSVAMLIENCQSIQDLRLQNCQLQYVGIQKIAEAMVKNTCLHFIDLNGNCISNQNAMFIACVIANNNNVQKLAFSNCKLQSTGCQQLLQAMAKITSLVHLDLSNNFLPHVEIDSFALMIHQNVSLEYLNISGCCDKATDFEKITHSLVILKSLIHLDLSCNATSRTSVKNIAIIIANNLCLNNLHLPECDVYKSAFLKILGALQNIHHLKYLHCNNISVGYEEATGIAAVISNNPFLENFNNHNLTEKDMKIILSSLRNHTLLKHFDISSDIITDHVVIDIVDVIDSNTQLTHLNISDTDIQEYKMLKIFKAVQQLNTLKSIKICNCAITNQAAQAIADAISVNCMMEELVFTNNDFHEIGISMVFDVLRKTHTMKRLTIASSYVVNTKNIIEVTEVVSSNYITHFDLSNCYLEKNGCLSILNSLKPQVPVLQRINLSGNNLSGGTAETMAQLISVSYYLQHVNLANTLMQGEEVMMIIKAMQNINSLHCVDFTSYSINDELAVELQKIIDNNHAMISFQFSRLFLKETEVTGMTLSKNIFNIVINLRKITICFTDCESKQVGTAVTLIKNNPYIKYLHLENCSMLEINISSIIVALSTNTTLEYVCLINFVITDNVDDGIATVLENNIQLKYFKLVACKLTEKGLTKSIQSFRFTRLSHLLLSKLNYLISDITRELQRPICYSLTHLTLSDVCLDTTKLSYLSLPALTKLQHLDLSHNPLTDESANILSSVILNNNDLQHLDLCDCKLQSEGIRIVADSLQPIYVTYLNMSLNTINVEIFDNNLMPALLPIFNHIEYLYLPYCELMPKEIDKIMDFISNAVYLICIDLGLNAISKSMVNKFKDIMFIINGFKEITFSPKGIKQVIDDETGNFYHSLHYLNINNITVDEEVGNTVAALIDNSPELVHLEMAGGYWNITNAMKCFRALRSSSYLVHLNLSNNSFTLTEIFHSLRGCTALRILDLHNCCSLKSTSTVSIATENPTFLHLSYLDLSNNYIDDEAVDYLAALIAANVGLEYLNFCNCKSSSSGIQNIINAFKVSSSLKFLDINFADSDGESIDDDLMVALLATNKYLEHLLLSNLVLDNAKLYQLQSHQCIIKLQRLIINDCIFTDKDTDAIISLIANSPKLRELILLNCEMSVKSKLKFTFVSAALNKQYLNLDTITIGNPVNISNKYSLNTNTPLHCNVSKLTLTDNDVVAVMTVDHNVGELIVFKLILNQNSLKVLSANTVAIRYLKLLHIQDCTFTDHYAHYVASLITNNATTIQSFSLASCQMSIKQKMIITKALCKLNIILLQYLNIEDIVHNTKLENFTKPSFINTNYKNMIIITAAMTDHINLIISKLVLNQITLTGLNLKLIKGVIHLTIKDYIFFDIETDNSIANILTNNGCIQQLVLSNCSFPFKSSAVFMGLSFLQTLNSISFDGILYFENFEDLMISIITNNPGLSQFTLCRCEITETVLVKIFHSISKVLRNLLYINFSHLKCSCEVVNHITTLISCNTKLKHINLCNCQLLTVDLKSIIQAAKNLTTLEYFDLSCNQVTGYLGNDITTLIANNKNIKEVKLPNYTLLITNCQVVLHTVTDILVNDIATIIVTNKSITKLSLLNCKLNNDQLKVVLFAVKECSVLPCVNFTIEEIENVTSTTQIIKLLVLKSTVVFHQKSDLMKFRGTHHLGIIGCSFDFEEWIVLKQFFAYSTILNTLILQDCQLYGTISEIVEVCTHLSYLDLTNVTIAGSSKSRFSSASLSDIKRKSNKLRTFSLNCMDCTEQTMVDVLNILTSSIIIDYFAMVNCNIYECGISNLWTPIYVCSNLVHLDLSYSRISGALVDCILADSKYLPCVKMASCSFDKKDVSLICNGLSKFHYIVHLNMNYNSNICYYASEIADVIRGNKNLRHIEIAGCNFDMNGITIMCKSCTRLHNINFSHNKITGDAIDAVVSVLHSDYLECINLQNCGLTSASSKNIIMALENTTTLKSVDLSLNEMAEDSAVHVAGMIANNKNIEVICLPDCVTFSSGIKINCLSLHHMTCIFDHIKDSKALRHVEFGSSKVNDILANNVAAITSRGLVVVKFSELILTNSGFKQLTNSILIMEGLNSISITGVHFTNTESYHLATLINNNKSVKSFDISNCVMSDKAKNIIFDEMINLTSLKSLNLKNIVISDTLEDKVLIVITNNTSLEYLEVTGCEINTAKLYEVTSSFNYLKVVSE